MSKFSESLNAMRRRGETQAAVALCRERLEEHPDDAEVLWQLGRLEASAGRMLAAAEVLQRAHRAAPDEVAVMHDLSKVLAAAGRQKEALQAALEVLKIKDDYAPGYNNLGQVLGNGGRLQEAIVAFEQASSIDPNFSPALENLANACDLTNQIDRATVLWERVAALRPDDPALWRRMGARYHAAGQFQQSHRCFAHWRALEPDNADALISSGTSAQMLGNWSEAEQCYRQALGIDASRADAWSNLGTLFQRNKELERATECYEKAVQINPLDPDGLAGLASVEELEGRHYEALALLEPLRDEIRSNPELTIVLARLLRRTGDLEASEEVVRSFLRSKNPSQPNASRLHFILGQTLDAAKRYDEAFDHYRKGNELTERKFDSVRHSELVDRIIEFFSRDTLAKLGGQEPSSPRMIFILGMPRSGTTLVEQTLSCHSAVTAMGELETLAQIASGRGGDATDWTFPASLAGRSRDDLRALADLYRRIVRTKAGHCELVTDKMPDNFLYIGLIELLFPDARIIHCRRNPMDVGVSLYFRNFARNALLFAYDQKKIGHYYCDYRRVMKHWVAVSRLPIHEVYYEDMVAKHESESRKLIEFLGLEWEQECLDFHNANRVTFTASNAQVRRRIYTHSVQRHKRYETQFAKLREALGPYASESE